MTKKQILEKFPKSTQLQKAMA